MDAATSALLGAAIGAVSGLGGAWITARMETRKHELDTMLKGAMEEWHMHIEKAQGQFIPPPLDYLTFWLVYYKKVLGKRKLTPEAVASAIEEAEAVHKVMLEQGKKIREQQLQGSED